MLIKMQFASHRFCLKPTTERAASGLADHVKTARRGGIKPGSGTPAVGARGAAAIACQIGDKLAQSGSERTTQTNRVQGEPFACLSRLTVWRSVLSETA